MKIYCPKCGFDRAYFTYNEKYFCEMCGTEMRLSYNDVCRIAADTEQKAKIKHFRAASANIVVALWLTSMVCAVYALLMLAGVLENLIIWWSLVAAYWIELSAKNLCDHKADTAAKEETA